MTIDVTERGADTRELIDRWRDTADDDNPAGPLYTGGDFVEGDIITATVGGSGRCGTVCTGSVKYHCC